MRVYTYSLAAACLALSAVLLSGCPPIMKAAFDYDPVKGTAPLTVQFTNLSSPAEIIDGYTWNFGDGSEVSEEEHPIHEFTTPGTHTVTLKALDVDEGTQVSATATVTVTQPVEPVADFEVDRTRGSAPFTVRFTDQSQEGTAGIKEYRWDYGDGTVVKGKGNKTHVYTDPGVWTMKLTVTSKDGTSDQKRATITVTNDMALVTAGLFRMGVPLPFDEPAEYPDIDAPADESSYADEEPFRWVQLDAYRIGRYEVSNEEFADMLNYAIEEDLVEYVAETQELELVGANGKVLYGLNSPGAGIALVGTVVEAVEGMEDLPVVSTTWYGAVMYCNWLSTNSGLTPCYNSSFALSSPIPDGYRLPTEAEWERAAGWDASQTEIPDPNLDTSGWMYIYPTSSDTLTDEQANVAGTLGEVAAVDDYGDDVSPAGCYNMAGNAAEWCQDRYASAYNENDTNNPLGPDAAEGTSERVLRGGDYSSAIEDCRSTVRESYAPANLSPKVGFRTARYED